MKFLSGQAAWDVLKKRTQPPETGNHGNSQDDSMVSMMGMGNPNPVSMDAGRPSTVSGDTRLGGQQMRQSMNSTRSNVQLLAISKGEFAQQSRMQNQATISSPSLRRTMGLTPIGGSGSTSRLRQSKGKQTEGLREVAAARRNRGDRQRHDVTQNLSMMAISNEPSLPRIGGFDDSEGFEDEF